MKEKVNVTGVPETMIQTLYARAKETKKQNAKIKDEIAVELVEKLDYEDVYKRQSIIWSVKKDLTVYLRRERHFAWN